MRVAVIYAALAVIQLVVCQSDFNGDRDHNLSTATKITPSQDSNPDERRNLRLERRFGEWILKRDTTTIVDAVASTSGTGGMASMTTSSSDARTTSESSTTTTLTTSRITSTTYSSFTTTTAGIMTTSSTYSTTTISSSSASSAASTTTTTAATTRTTSTTTPTPTESTELKQWNHRGTIAAIVTFSILGSFFVGACIAGCFRNRAKKRRIEATRELDKESSLSMLTMTPENGKPASQSKVDRESIMFCDERRSRRESVPSEDMGRSMSSGRHTPMGVREHHGTAEV